MIVIINGKLYDAAKTPMALVLSPLDKLNVFAMHPNNSKLMAWPTNYPQKKRDAMLLKYNRKLNEYWQKGCGKKLKS